MMALRELLLISGILVTIAGQSGVSDKDLKNIIPHHYTIKIEPHYTSYMFRGMVTIGFYIRNATRTLTLNSNVIFESAAVVTNSCQTKVPDVILRGSGHVSSTRHQIYVATEMERKNRTLKLTFENTLSNRNYCLSIPFFGTIVNKYTDMYKGLYSVSFTTSGGNKSSIFSSYTINGAHELFPHFDDSTDKATYNISIQHHAYEIALSSMPKYYSEPEEVEIGKMWLTHFYTIGPIPANAIAIAVIPELLNVTSSGDVKMWNNIRMWNNIGLWNEYASPGDLYYDPSRIEVAEKTMSVFITKFGKLKTPQINFIAVPGLQYNTVAKLGLVVHREEEIMFDAAYSTTSDVQRSAVSRFIARQIALQWLIASVQPTLWSYEWFNAAADFFGIYALDKMFETSNAMNCFVIHTVHDSLRLDVNGLMEPVVGQGRNMSPTFHVPPFLKVSAILHSMERTLGELFWRHTRRFLDNEPVLSDNIWSCLVSHVVTQWKPNEKGCVWKWIQTNNYPLLSVREINACRNNVHVQDSSLNMTGQYSESQYTMLFIYRFPIEAQNMWDEWIQDHFLFRNPLILPYENNTDCSSTINFNQTGGYFRVTYEHEKWMQISLNDASLYKKLPVLKRAQIIDDECHLLLRKIKKPQFFWCNITQYLLHEVQYEVWYPMFRLLEDLSGFLPFTDLKFLDFKVLMQNLLNTLLGLVQLDHMLNIEVPFLVRLRYEAFKWACLFDSYVCTVVEDTDLNDVLNRSIFERKEKRPTYLWQEWIFLQ